MNAIYDRLLQDLSQHLTTLPDKPAETPETTLRALWFAAVGQPRSAAASAGTGALPLLEPDGAAAQVLRELVARRLAGEPLAHITGRQHFMGMEMLSGPEALIPRAETEQLAGCAIGWLQRMGRVEDAMVMDVCTGSGNLALAIAKHVPGARVHAADISDDAIALAQRNAVHLGLAQRVAFSVGDMLAPFDGAGLHGNVDLIVCNPPYISSAKVATMPVEISRHEPAAAFDGGALGVSILMRLVDAAPHFLRGGGYLAFEVGAGQGPAMARRLQSRPEYTNVQLLEDAGGVVRVLAVQRSEPVVIHGKGVA